LTKIKKTGFTSKKLLLRTISGANINLATKGKLKKVYHQYQQ